MSAGPRIERDSQGERAPGLPSRHGASPPGFLQQGGALVARLAETSVGVL